MFVRLRAILRASRCLSSHRQLHASPVCWAKTLREFKLADIGEGITECEVIKWNVSPPSRVGYFDPLCEVQSDKASVEITSPFEGILKQLLVQEGEVAKVGAGLCLIEVEEDVPAVADENSASPPIPDCSRTLHVEGDPLHHQKQTLTPRPHPMDPRASSPPSPSGGQVLLPRSSVLATPSVRHLARKHGIDLEKLAPGSGKNGRIEKADVERFIATSEIPTNSVMPKTEGEDVVVELGRTRYGMWKAMTKSLEIPHFGYSTSLDLTALHSILPVLNSHIPHHFLPPSSSSLLTQASVSPLSVYGHEAGKPISYQIPEGGHFSRLTYLPFLLKTLGKAMMEWPLFRSSITPMSADQVSPPSKPTLTIRPHPAISIALSTPTGLYTPTLTSIHTSSIYEIASSLSRLSFLGRQIPCGLTVNDMPKKGGTVTVSNIGAIGKGEWASPVLVPGGGVAIVAIGRATWVWDVDGSLVEWDGKGKRRLKAGISWSADHRVVEGAELAAFVECWRGWVESPERLIGEGV